MEEIKTIEEAIKLLTERRGFQVEDYSKVRYRVYDEDIDDLYDSDEELINYANDQAKEDLY